MRPARQQTDVHVPYLLDNRLAPLTFSWSFIRAPLDQVVRSYVRWQRIILHRVTSARLDFGLEDALAYLQPLDIGCSRILFLSTRSDWTAIFGNSALGDRPPVAAYMSERMLCRGLDCIAIPNTASARRQGPGLKSGVWGCVELTLHAPQRVGTSNRERCIRVANDVRGWEFHLSGTVQPFEEPVHYSAARKAERFTTEILERYGRALGLELFDPEFYAGPGVLTRSTPWFLPGPQSVTLKEARVRLGIEPA